MILNFGISCRIVDESPTGIGQRSEHVGHTLAEGDGGHLHVALHLVGQHTGGVVDQALGQLAGVGEHLVELLHLLLQVGHDVAAIGTHRVNRQLEGVASRVGSHRPHQIDAQTGRPAKLHLGQVG